MAAQSAFGLIALAAIALALGERGGCGVVIDFLPWMVRARYPEPTGNGEDVES